MSRAGSIMAFALLLALAGVARSELAEVAAWRVECTGDGKTLDCRAVQHLVERTPNRPDQLLVAVLVRRPADSKQAVMLMQLPLGLPVTEAVLIKVDNGPTENQHIQTCTNVGCFVTFTINDKFLASMRTGKTLRITVQNAQKKPVELPLPLLGFALAYDKVK